MVFLCCFITDLQQSVYAQKTAIAGGRVEANEIIDKINDNVNNTKTTKNTTNYNNNINNNNVTITTTTKTMIPTGENPKGVTSKPPTNTTQTKNDSSGRSAALERAYVHDVYENCDEPTGALRPSVAQFLSGLETGSLVCDVGCGNGRYLTANFPNIIPIGIDRCQRLSKVARDKGGEVSLRFTYFV